MIMKLSSRLKEIQNGSWIVTLFYYLFLNGEHNIGASLAYPSQI